jgi:hypothetical protein
MKPVYVMTRPGSAEFSVFCETCNRTVWGVGTSHDADAALEVHELHHLQVRESNAGVLTDHDRELSGA